MPAAGTVQSSWIIFRILLTKSSGATMSHSTPKRVAVRLLVTQEIRLPVEFKSGSRLITSKKTKDAGTPQRHVTSFVIFCFGGRHPATPASCAAAGGRVSGPSLLHSAVCGLAAVDYRSYPRVCSIYCTGYTLSSTGSGSESPPGWRQYTLGQVMRWGGVLIKP